MSSSLFSLYSLFWTGFQLAQVVLCLWIAIIVFRQRGAASWMTLTGAVAMPAFMIASRVVIATGGQWGMGNSGGSGMPRYLEIAQALGLGYSVAMLSFLVGLLLHLQRRKLESDRIAELEAILHDLQQNSDTR